MHWPKVSGNKETKCIINMDEPTLILPVEWIQQKKFWLSYFLNLVLPPLHFRELCKCHMTREERHKSRRIQYMCSSLSFKFWMTMRMYWQSQKSDTKTTIMCVFLILLSHSFCCVLYIYTQYNRIFYKLHWKIMIFNVCFHIFGHIPTNKTAIIKTHCFRFSHELVQLFRKP